MTPLEHRRLADILSRADANRRPVPALSASYPELRLGDALRIRDLAVDSRLRAGEILLGAKPASGRLAASSAHSGLHLGWITSGMIPGPTVNSSEFSAPRVVAALAFRLGRPLDRPVTQREMVALVDSVHPCVEILDFRSDPSASSQVDEIADNCRASRVVLGPPCPALAAIGRDIGVRVRSEGAGLPLTLSSTAPAHLFDSVTDLANSIVKEGVRFAGGALLLTPACGESLALPKYAVVSAEFGLIGAVSVQSTSPAAR